EYSVTPTLNLIAPNPASPPSLTEMSVCVRVLKPGALTSTLYVPVGIKLNRKSPALPVVVFNSAPVAVLVAFTWAFDTSAPCGSVTVPEIEPFSTWPTPVMQNMAAKPSATESMRLYAFRCILKSPSNRNERYATQAATNSACIVLFENANRGPFAL